MKFLDAAQQVKRMGQVFRAFAQVEEVLLAAGQAEAAVERSLEKHAELTGESSILLERTAALRGEKKALKAESLTERVKAAKDLKDLLHVGDLQLREQKSLIDDHKHAAGLNAAVQQEALEEKLQGLRLEIQDAERYRDVAVEAARVARDMIKGLG